MVQRWGSMFYSEVDRGYFYACDTEEIIFVYICVQMV